MVKETRRRGKERGWRGKKEEEKEEEEKGDVNNSV